MKAKKSKKQVKNQMQSTNPSYYFSPKIEEKIEKRLSKVLVISIIVQIALGFLLFDLRVSEGGDDSYYIKAAWDFIKGQSFPSWHGSLYPIILSIFVLAGGLNLAVLKAFSLLLTVLNLYLFYRFFKSVISPIVLLGLMLILAINPSILYYASQTYNEPMFMVIQTWFIGMTFLLNDKFKSSDSLSSYKKEWKFILLYVLVLFCFIQTKNIAITGLIACIVFLVINKKYKLSVIIFSFTFILNSLYTFAQKVFWGVGKTGFQSQFQEIFLKNPYNKTLGKEDLEGMLTRFFENTQIYLSKHFYSILGLRPESNIENNIGLAFIVAIPLLLSVILLLFNQKNKKMLFVALYTVGSLVATFLSVQQLWGQLRLVLIYVPFILIIIFWFIHYISAYKNLGYVKHIIVIFLAIFIINNLKTTSQRIKEHENIRQKNFKGNLYAGYTNDYVNFLRMSEWASKNITDSARIASRKPSMSFIYGDGKDFFGIYRFLMYNPQNLMNSIKEKHHDIFAIDMKQLRGGTISRQFQYYLGRNNVGFIYDNSSSYILVKKDSASQEMVFNELKSNNLTFEPTYEGFYSKIEDKIDQYNSTSSDSLLHHLYKNDVEYIIRGSLRVNPKQKTNRTINTIARFMYYIELKYPGIFKLVQQVGEAENEPAHLFKINYDAYKINEDSFK